jgi:hypothetical protein
MPSIKELVERTEGFLQIGSTFALSEGGADWLNKDRPHEAGGEKAPGEILIYDQHTRMDSLDPNMTTLSYPNGDGCIRVPTDVDLFSSMEPPEWWED